MQVYIYTNICQGILEDVSGQRNAWGQAKRRASVCVWRDCTLQGASLDELAGDSA